jgi:hypothetical protein
MWVNVLVLYPIGSELLFKRFVIFKCYFLNCTTTMTARDRDRWWKYSSRAEKRQNIE